MKRLPSLLLSLVLSLALLVPVFAADACKEIREQHRAGIPCIVIDDEVIPVNSPEHMQQLIEQYQLQQA